MYSHCETCFPISLPPCSPLFISIYLQPLFPHPFSNPRRNQPLDTLPFLPSHRLSLTLVGLNASTSSLFIPSKTSIRSAHSFFPPPLSKRCANVFMQAPCPAAPSSPAQGAPKRACSLEGGLAREKQGRKEQRDCWREDSIWD